MGPRASGKVAATKGDEAPWQPVKKKGKLVSLGSASPSLSHGHPLERSPATLSPASVDEQPLKRVKILSGSAEAHDLHVRVTDRFTLLQGLGDGDPETLATTLSPCDSLSLPPRDLELVFSTLMEMLEHN